MARTGTSPVPRAPLESAFRFEEGARRAQPTAVNLRNDPGGAPSVELPSWLKSSSCPATLEAACIADASTSTPALAPAPALFAQHGAQGMLVTAVDARLATMRAMAATKWASGTRIEDPPREAEVLGAVTTQAVELGLDTTSVRRWFVAQMTAAREVQRHWHEAWGRNGMCGECRRPTDLAVMRRFIDASNATQLRALHLLAADAVDAQVGPAGSTDDEVAACLCWLGRRYGLAEATTASLVTAFRAVHRARD